MGFFSRKWPLKVMRVGRDSGEVRVITRALLFHSRNNRSCTSCLPDRYRIKVACLLICVFSVIPKISSCFKIDLKKCVLWCGFPEISKGCLDLICMTVEQGCHQRTMLSVKRLSGPEGENTHLQEWASECTKLLTRLYLYNPTYSICCVNESPGSHSRRKGLRKVCVTERAFLIRGPPLRLSGLRLWAPERSIAVAAVQQEIIITHPRNTFKICQPWFKAMVEGRGGIWLPTTKRALVFLLNLISSNDPASCVRVNIVNVKRSQKCINHSIDVRLFQEQILSRCSGRKKCVGQCSSWLPCLGFRDV